MPRGVDAGRTRYDDGGFSGGNMERPALQHLLSDIRTSRIDIVVVYKVDRLTRSLADFARLVEIFDAQGVSFVLVTQEFDTTSSMGRLTMVSVTGLVDRWRRHHEVSMLIAVAGAGRRFGWQPPAKVSMMIMRPPQQRQGRGRTRGWSAAVVSDVSACFGRDGTASNPRARAMLAARLPLANNP